MRSIPEIARVRGIGKALQCVLHLAKQRMILTKCLCVCECTKRIYGGLKGQQRVDFSLVRWKFMQGCFRVIENLWQWYANRASCSCLNCNNLIDIVFSFSHLGIKLCTFWIYMFLPWSLSNCLGEFFYKSILAQTLKRTSCDCFSYVHFLFLRVLFTFYMHKQTFKNIWETYVSVKN